MIYLDLRQALIHRLVGVVAPVAPEAGVVLPFCVFCEYKMVKKNSIRIEMLENSKWMAVNVSLTLLPFLKFNLFPGSEHKTSYY